MSKKIKSKAKFFSMHSKYLNNICKEIIENYSNLFTLIFIHNFFPQ